MTKIVSLFMITAALACSTFARPAHAAPARDRVFVASYGNDSNPCTFGSPCKTFQHAHDVVAAGGEITAIDSAGFGPISITKAVTVTSPAGVEAGIVPVAGGNAITVNAQPTDAVVLRGLTLNGSGTAYNGIVFNAGASLTVSDCVLENFAFVDDQLAGIGIAIAPSSAGTFNIDINNTVITSSQGAGIFYDAPSGSSNATSLSTTLPPIPAPTEWLSVQIPQLVDQRTSPYPTASSAIIAADME
jgi:hypothetical protein